MQTEGFNLLKSRLAELNTGIHKDWAGLSRITENCKFKVGSSITSKEDVYMESDEGYVFIPAGSPVQVTKASESKYTLRTDTGSYEMDKSMAESKFKSQDEEKDPKGLDPAPSRAPIGGKKQGEGSVLKGKVESLRDDLNRYMAEANDYNLAKGHRVKIKSYNKSFWTGLGAASIQNRPVNFDGSQLVGEQGIVVSAYAMGPGGPEIYRVSTRYGNFDFLDSEIGAVLENDEFYDQGINFMLG